MLDNLIDNSQQILRKLNQYYDYLAIGKGRKPSRENEPDRLLNPSKNGTVEMFKELKHCAEHFYLGTLSEKVRKRLKEFEKAAVGLVEGVERYFKSKSLNVSYTVESDLVKYLLSRPPAGWNMEQHCAKIAKYVESLEKSFYENSDAAYVHIDDIESRPVTVGFFTTHMNAVTTQVADVQDGMNWLRRNIPKEYISDIEAQVHIKGVRLEEFRKVCELRAKHPTLQPYELCKLAWMKGAGYPTIDSLCRYCMDHRQLLGW